jgi:recombination protein RecA
MNPLALNAQALPLPEGAPRPAVPLEEPRPVWRLATLAGRLVELSGGAAGAALTLAFGLVLEAQRNGEPVAWIGRRDSAFYPPDVVEAGVDLEALVVVWAPGMPAALRAADHLLRSGGFGLAVLDLGAQWALPIPAQTRLSGLAGKHSAAVLCLTEKDPKRPSLGSLVSLRAQAERTERAGERWRCEAAVLKDKRRGPGWKHAEVCRAPDGLC